MDGQEPIARKRRQSQTSAKSNGSAAGQRKPSLRDYILGEELGRGSYSTVRPILHSLGFIMTE